METTLTAAWEYFGKPWFYRTSLLHSLVVILFVVWSVLLEQQYAPTEILKEDSELARRLRVSGGGSTGAAGDEDQYDYVPKYWSSMSDLWSSGITAKALLWLDAVFIMLALVELSGPLHTARGNLQAAFIRYRALLLDKWTAIDKLGSVGLLSTALAHLIKYNDVRYTSIIAAFTSVFVWLRVCFILRGLNETSKLVTMVYKVSDFWHFLLPEF